MMYENILPVIEDFIIGFQRDSEAFSEDTVIRRDLYSALYRHFSSQGTKFQIKKPDLAIAYYPERESVTLTPVKTAYPVAEKFDIAVLDPAAVRPLADAESQEEKVRYNRYWEQPVAAALQIHLCKADQEPEKYFRKLKGDLKKFAGYAEESVAEDFTGLSILLVQGEMEGLAEAEMPEMAGSHARIVAENGIFAWESGN